MNFNSAEEKAAQMFLVLFGTGGDSEKVVWLTKLLRSFYLKGLRNSKDEFLQSSDATEGCKVCLEGYGCNCFLCRIDRAIEVGRDVRPSTSEKQQDLGGES